MSTSLDRPDGNVDTVIVLSKGTYPDDGGIERYTWEIARAYAATGLDVHLLAPATARPHPSELKQFTSAKFVRAWAQPVVAVTLAFALCRLLLRTGLHRSPGRVVIHATTWRTATLATLLPHQQRPIVAITCHGRELHPPGSMTRRLMRRVARRADHLVAVSSTTGDIATSALGRTPVVVHNGPGLSPDGIARIRAARAAPTSSTRPLTVCRLVERKNVAGVLRAIAILRDRGIELEPLDVVGRGPQLEELRLLQQQLQLDDLVRFRGFVPDGDLLKFYERAGVFVHPQIAVNDGHDVEGFGLVIADAMACGIPVIVGDVGGPTELVLDGETGLVVDGTNPDAIADAISALLDDQALRGAIGSRAQAWVDEHLSWRHHVEVVLALASGERESDS